MSTAANMLARRSTNKALCAKIAEMRLKLSPLVSIETGLVHKAFPKTLLHYWLLTESELDALAHHYHQAEETQKTHQYPKAMNWKKDLSLEQKRRKWGKFIGLGGCETPVGSREEVDWERAVLERVRKGREEEEMLRRKTLGYY